MAIVGRNRNLIFISVYDLWVWVCAMYIDMKKNAFISYIDGSVVVRIQSIVLIF